MKTAKILKQQQPIQQLQLQLQQQQQLQLQQQQQQQSDIASNHNVIVKQEVIEVIDDELQYEDVEQEEEIDYSQTIEATDIVEEDDEEAINEDELLLFQQQQQQQDELEFEEQIIDDQDDVIGGGGDDDEEDDEAVLNDGTFLSEHLFDNNEIVTKTFSDEEVFVNEVTLEDNVNEVTIEENINEVIIEEEQLSGDDIAFDMLQEQN